MEHKYKLPDMPNVDAEIYYINALDSTIVKIIDVIKETKIDDISKNMLMLLFEEFNKYLSKFVKEDVKKRLALEAWANEVIGYVNELQEFIVETTKILKENKK